jgi:hypothetical protein
MAAFKTTMSKTATVQYHVTNPDGEHFLLETAPRCGQRQAGQPIEFHRAD